MAAVRARSAEAAGIEAGERAVKHGSKTAAERDNAHRRRNEAGVTSNEAEKLATEVKGFADTAGAKNATTFMLLTRSRTWRGHSAASVSHQVDILLTKVSSNFSRVFGSDHSRR
jgi:hypothetical protein